MTIDQAVQVLQSRAYDGTRDWQTATHRQSPVVASATAGRWITLFDALAVAKELLATEATEGRMPPEKRE